MSKKIIAKTKTHFEGKVVYDKDSLFRLFRASDNVYRMRRIIVRFVSGAFLAVGGALAPIPMIFKVVMMMVGCWFLASRDFSARNRVDLTLEKRKATLPEMKTILYDEHIWLESEGSMSIPYKKIQYLFKDEDYYFMFLSEQSACMIAKDTLFPDRYRDFEHFLEEKTGQTWQEYKSFLQMNLSDLKIAFSKIR